MKKLQRIWLDRDSLNILKINKEELQRGGVYEYLYLNTLTKENMDKVIKTYDPKLCTVKVLAESSLKNIKSKKINIHPIPIGQIAALEDHRLSKEERDILVHKLRHYSNAPLLNWNGEVMPSTGIRHFPGSKFGTHLLQIINPFDIYKISAHKNKNFHDIILEDWCSGEFFECQCERDSHFSFGMMLNDLPEDLTLKALEYLELKDYITFALTNKDNKRLSLQFKQYWLNLLILKNAEPLDIVNILAKKGHSSSSVRRYAKICTSLQSAIQKCSEYANLIYAYEARMIARELFLLHEYCCTFCNNPVQFKANCSTVPSVAADILSIFMSCKPCLKK